MAQRSWFITGAGRGLGHAFARAALERGDDVIGTVRQPGSAADLAAEFPGRFQRRQLDVKDRAAVVTLLGDIATPDIVINNAGYGLVGALEEISEEQATEQFAVNLFGAMWVTQAVLPGMRERGSGRIVQVSSVGAVGHLPLFGVYNATKWALEGMSAALADEVAPHGIRVHLLQLGGFATDWAGSSMRYAEARDAYAATREAIFGTPGYPEPVTPTHSADEPPGDEPPAEESPAVAAQALLDLLDEPDPPLRKIIGTGAHDMVRMALEARRDDYRRDPAFTWP
ncbi:SDR family NAD(P)-dependent oxidoreductase [Actinoplanes sp. NPDC051494]|uniref:SDR family NAD(P)-dependent oxidoreductase n=1 Tax=Actinoplanes sp. NPDC051494 TaxID=3363907 RepID=UPI00379097C3